MSAAARDLACHLARVLKSNPVVFYHLGPYTQTWDLLCAAISSITGETPEAAHTRLKREMAGSAIPPRNGEGDRSPQASGGGVEAFPEPPLPDSQLANDGACT